MTLSSMKPTDTHFNIRVNRAADTHHHDSIPRNENMKKIRRTGKSEDRVKQRTENRSEDREAVVVRRSQEMKFNSDAKPASCLTCSCLLSPCVSRITSSPACVHYGLTGQPDDGAIRRKREQMESPARILVNSNDGTA